MKIGVLKETAQAERRVAMTPDIVKKLVGKGYEVCIESGAGDAASFTDSSYTEVGARVVPTSEVFSAQVIARVRKPTEQDLSNIQAGTVLISLVESCGEDALLNSLVEKGVTVLAMEKTPRISRAQAMDVLSSQSNIAGYRAVIEAAAHFGRFFPLMMTSAGSAKPARVVILGVGVAGLQAIATAKRIGADVYAYDVRPETKEQIESLGAKAIELDIGESGSGEGGYAKELSDEAKVRQQQALADELAKAHVIISTALIPCRPAPTLIPEETVMRMRSGSVIIDLAASTGGNCPLSKVDEVVTQHGVIIVGYSNYPSMVPADASAFYAGNVFNLLGIMVERSDAGLQLKNLDEDEITQAMQLKPDS